MNKDLMRSLISKAKESSENAYCPYTNKPVGCALWVEGNKLFGGCNIENGVLSVSLEAGEVAVSKAISEGYTKFLAICFYAENDLPYPSGKTLQLLFEFSDMVQVLVANEADFVLHQLYELMPLRPSPPEV